MRKIVQQLNTTIYTSSKTSEDGVILILLGKREINDNKKLGEWNTILIFISSLFFPHSSPWYEKIKTLRNILQKSPYAAFGQMNLYWYVQVLHF